MTIEIPKTWRKPEVALIGQDGNAFAILGRCSRAAKNAGNSANDISLFMSEAKSGNYDHLLCTVMDWFETDPDEDDNFETDPDEDDN